MADRKSTSRPTSQIAPQDDEENSNRSATRKSRLKEAFIIAPIGDTDSDTRRRSDQILKHIITPELTRRAYKPVRADSIDQSGSITSQIIGKVIEADLVIADLTDHNPNVFYELAIRHSAAKPFVQLIQADQSIPFDIAAYRTIFLDHRDLDSAASARETLGKMIDAIAEESTVDTPVRQAVDFAGLRASGNPEEKQLAGLSDQVSRLTRVVRGELQGSRTSLADHPDFVALRAFIRYLSSSGRLNEGDEKMLVTTSTTAAFDQWISGLKFTSPDSWGAPSGWESSSASDEPPF